MASELSIPSTAPPPTTSWSSLLTKPSQPPNQAASSTLAAGRQLLDGCKSSKGVAVAVVDANAIIQGGERLSSSADRFVSVAEVLSEIRDPTSRHRLSVLPFTVETMEPSPESLKKVISFARATGDLQTLSDVDLKLIALTYSLEAQIHGTKHLRDSPPPIHIHNVRRLPEKELPGWGANVPNLEEWEALEGLAETVANNDSKILLLKDLSLNVQSEDNVSLQDGSVGNGSENNFVDNVHSDEKSERSSRYPIKKREVEIDGKKMVVDGIDASQGQYDEDAGDWNPAVSRGTRRRFLKRQAKREMNEASLKNNEETDVTEETEYAMIEKSEVAERAGEMEDEEISSVMEQMRLEDSCLDDEHNVCELNNDGAEHFETSSQATESLDTSYVDGLSSEQSWSLRSLSDSSIACVTGDFAMQNVILQIGLRLLAPGGMQIRELHRWVLKCHACNKVTNEIGRIFCPKCGNGGTLRKVAVTVGENGVVLAARRQRFCLRGTKFSLPLPQGGRAAITKNPILREDQLPQRFGVFFRDDQLRNSKGRNKKGNNKDMDFCAVDDIFSGRADKKEPLKPAVRQALTMFSGRKNPNDNHYSWAKH